MKRKRKKPDNKIETSFIKEYNFEITVLTMFLLGVFLLVENMEISATLFKLIKTGIFFFADFIKSIRNTIYHILNWLEISDLVGVALILFALNLVLIRTRIRLLNSYPKVYECQSCDNTNKLKRVQKNFKHRIIQFVLRLRVYYYQCDNCFNKQLIMVTKKR
tara:strand:+ start:126 stop:611 length:486 start_codon:yes stop_codon:yes gene_type:complete